MYNLYWKWNDNSAEGDAEVEITTYEAENLINPVTSGSAFIFSDNVKIKIT